MRKGKGRTLLQVAASRLQHVSRQQWAGFLTPRQALALHAVGIELESGAIAYARRRRNRGIKLASWTYLSLSRRERDGLLAGVQYAA